jgi:NAD(P)H-hydrate epimerase
MWLLTQAESKALDLAAITAGSDENALIKIAGLRLAAETLKIILPGCRLLVLCGPGHNGDDGKVLAWELSRQGFPVDIVSFNNLAALKSQKLNYDVYIDALFGTGLSRSLDEITTEIIGKVNASSGIKISVDIPSGLSADTGNACGTIFKADHTLTIERPKPGFFLNQGPEHCGKIHRVRGVFSSTLVRSHAHSVFLLPAKLAQRWLPTRRATDNKTRGGKVLILAGQSQMPGAALLASSAAARVGAGYVYVSDKDLLHEKPEFLLWDQKDFSPFSAALVGPGLGVHDQTRALLTSLMKEKIPVVVDADALTVLAQMKWQKLPAHWIFTPHAGELSRLIPLTSKEIERDRLQAARKAHEHLGGVVLLKGFHSVIACKEALIIVPTGNAALGKAGSGDVLAGMIAGFLSQGLSSERAALLACYLHGWIADEWLGSGKDILSLQPSDLLAQLPTCLAQFRSVIL